MKMSKIFLGVWFLGALSAFGQAVNLNTSRIDEITQLKGKYNVQENVCKVSVPRNDIKVSVDKWEMPPFMRLTSWAAFQPSAKVGTMIMGDIVLLQDEAENGKLIKVGDFEAGPNSHTVSVDSSTHKVYLPLKNLDGAPVLRIMIPKMEVSQ